MEKSCYRRGSLILVVLVIAMLLNSATVYGHTNDDASWYRTVDGVLSSDYFYMYPYVAHDLKIGFSKFGEMIYSPAGATAVGLSYEGHDAFAGWPDQKSWQNGWLIRIAYQHIDYGPRYIWAFALFSDKVQAGGDWNDLSYTGDPRGGVPGNGGRKTNGEAETDAITLLYNTPRSAAYMLRTHIYDDLDNISGSPARIALVDLIFTIEFNKVKKEVIIKKDVLLKAPYKDIGGDKKLYIDFSNRGEWDLGPSPAYASNAYFFTQGQHDSSTALFPTMWRNAPIYSYSGAGNREDNAADARTTKYKSPNIDCQRWHWPGIDPTGYYDVAQIISSDNAYVGWAAYWPMIQYWSVYGWDFWFQALSEAASEAPWAPATTAYDTNKVADWSRRNNIAGTWYAKQAGNLAGAPANTETITEPKIPYIIGEWSFNLAHAVTQADRTQFRGVTVYGVTNRNDAVDDTTLDGEAVFQLDEIFNPFDLWDVVHKQTSRIVDFFTGTGGTTTYTLSHTPLDPATTPWDKYCSFAERVLVAGVLKTRIDYVLNKAAKTITLWAPAGATIMVLYSTEPKYEKVDDFIYDKDAQQVHPLTYISKTMTMQAVVDPSNGKSIDPAKYRRFDTAPTDGYWDAIQIDAAATYVGGGDVPDNTMLKVVYEVVLGTMKWAVVGKEAGIIDSAGAALVTEAFNSIKGINVEVSGMDMKDLIHAPKSPFIFYRFTAGAGTRTDYRDGLGRARLNNDFCTKHPIDSSDLIYVGGPLANLGSEYANDFLPLMYGMSDQYRTTASAYAGKIVAWNCWLHPKQTWSNTGTTGYAVITVYKDINGAVHLNIWGMTGEDTYWATYWFYNGNDGTPGIVELQSINPGTVGIVLTIDYTAHAPTVSIDHRQGTISCKCPTQTDLTAP